MTTFLITSYLCIKTTRQTFGNLYVTLVINISLLLVAKSSVIDDECSLQAISSEYAKLWMWVREEWGKEERGREECRGWEGGGERRNEGKNKGRGTQGRNWEGKRKGRNWEKSKITSFWKFHKRGKMLTVEDLGSSLVLRLHTVFIACTVTVSCCVRHEIKGRGTPVFLCLYTGSFDFRLSEVTFSSTIICEWNWLPLTFTSTDKALLTCKWLYQGGVMFPLANPSPPSLSLYSKWSPVIVPIYRSLSKEHPPSKEFPSPPPPFAPISMQYRVKVYSNECPPCSKLCVANVACIRGVVRSTASSATHNIWRNFVLHCILLACFV